MLIDALQILTYIPLFFRTFYCSVSSWGEQFLLFGNQKVHKKYLFTELVNLSLIRTLFRHITACVQKYARIVTHSIVVAEKEKKPTDVYAYEALKSWCSVRIYILMCFPYLCAAATAYSVWRLTTGWTIWDRTPGGTRVSFFPYTSRPAPSPTQPPAQWLTFHNRG